MNIVVFDTETTNINKPFCYNIGYCIVDVTTGNVLLKRDYVVEQAWYNHQLFATAYYAEKRPIYVNAMRSRATIMDKYGYICRTMHQDFRKYKVVGAYAYNSPFDERVFNYNCDWYKCINPFDVVPIFDIRGYAMSFIVDDTYKAFCEANSLFTEAGNYSTTAEAMYKFLTGDINFVEAHTALSDSEIEKDILLECFKRGAVVNHDYPVMRSIERVVPKTLDLTDKQGTVHTFDYNKIMINKDRTKIWLK